MGPNVAGVVARPYGGSVITEVRAGDVIADGVRMSYPIFINFLKKSKYELVPGSVMPNARKYRIKYLNIICLYRKLHAGLPDARFKTGYFY